MGEKICSNCGWLGYSETCSKCGKGKMVKVTESSKHSKKQSN